MYIIFQNVHFLPILRSLRTTTSLVALEYSQPPNSSKCGPIEVAVCPYLFKGGVPIKLPFSQAINSVFKRRK